jgi:hypothetical protein
VGRRRDDAGVARGRRRASPRRCAPGRDALDGKARDDDPRVAEGVPLFLEQLRGARSGTIGGRPGADDPRRAAREPHRRARARGARCRLARPRSSGARSRGSRSARADTGRRGRGWAAARLARARRRAPARRRARHGFVHPLVRGAARTTRSLGRAGRDARDVRPLARPAEQGDELVGTHLSAPRARCERPGGPRRPRARGVGSSRERRSACAPLVRPRGSREPPGRAAALWTGRRRIGWRSSAASATR